MLAGAQFAERPSRTASERSADVRATGESNGWDVELYSAPEALLQRTITGVGDRTSGRVAHVFEHRANRPHGLFFGKSALWMAIREFETAAQGNQVEVDPGTDHAVYRMYRMCLKAQFSPASFIRRIVHIVHRCPLHGADASGQGVTRAGGEERV